jgi:ELWxxDGT repeat protein
VIGDGRSIFTASDGTNGRELRVTDGTAGGTQLLADIRPGVQRSNPEQLFRMDEGRLLFRADDGALGRELWITDGTAEGTRQVADIRAGVTSSAPSQFMRLRILAPEPPTIDTVAED